MAKPTDTIWDICKSRGHSRRDFLRFCSFATAAAGFETSTLAAVADVFEKKTRPPIVWLHFQECTCCSESFLRASHPVVADVLLDSISLDYTETLQAAAGHRAEKCKQDTMKAYPGQYILVVEGSVPTGNDGIYCVVGGRSALDLLREAAEHAAVVVAWGNCASHGCVQAAAPNPTGATPIHKLINKAVVRVPGCPPIADVMVALITHLLMFGRPPELDSQGRPKEFYARRVHDTCYRRPYYDAGMFVESWDDAGARKGYCLYRMGCRGPIAYNACAVTKWNGNTSYPIQSGHGCIGCSEEGFWDHGPLYQHLASFPGLGIEATADKIGAVLAAGTAVGVAAHAVTTNIRRRDLIRAHVAESVDHGKDHDTKGTP